MEDIKTEDNFPLLDTGFQKNAIKRAKNRNLLTGRETEALKAAALRGIDFAERDLPAQILPVSGVKLKRVRGTAVFREIRKPGGKCPIESGRRKRLFYLGSNPQSIGNLLCRPLHFFVNIINKFIFGKLPEAFAVFFYDIRVSFL